MSEFHVVVVQVGKIEKHPNADTLSMTKVLGDYPVILKTGWLKEGDKAVYVPVDAVMPKDDPEYEYLGPSRRVKAKKLRGIFSMGMLAPALPEWEIGRNVQKEMKIEKYEPPEPIKGGEDEKDPGFLHVYTDIEGLRRYPDVLQEGENVVITEKIHGANGRWLWRDGRLWAGSHTCIKKPDGDTMWWKVAAKYDLENKLKTVPNISLYGEVYGQVQDLRYGSRKGELLLALFDAKDTMTYKFLDYENFKTLAARLDLPTVPELYKGPWKKELSSVLAEGNSVLADHVREGFVVRPLVERWSDQIGRVILKRHGEGYLTRKEK